MECPVALAHNRVGFSLDFTVRAAECSICGQNAEDCPHIKGREYDGAVCHRVITRAGVLRSR